MEALIQEVILLGVSDVLCSLPSCRDNNNKASSANTNIPLFLHDPKTEGVPEMTLPHTNLVNFRAQHEKAIAIDDWNIGMTSGVDNPGYGTITVTDASLTLEAKGRDGSVRHQLVLG